MDNYIFDNYLVKNHLGKEVKIMIQEEAQEETGTLTAVDDICIEVEFRQWAGVSIRRTYPIAKLIYLQSAENPQEDTKQSSHTKEFHDMQAQFEKDIQSNDSIRHSDTTRDTANVKGIWYCDGNVNQLFHAYMLGYMTARQGAI